MRFSETALPGAFAIELDTIADERGWFARTFDAEEFRARGLQDAVAQCNASFNARRGTLRGLHWQADPYRESKLVRCVRGAIFDVAVDIRPDSPAFCCWEALELSAENRLAFYIPAGMAHGFQTLTDDCEVLYQMGNRYVPEAARGARWDDAAFAIRWPAAPGGRIISDKDRGYPDFDRSARP
ncbi:MAG TPA: dTDP-4-dehydrorhamnose 3,5-epimerase [Solirubrobacteraceae bacterium]|nr:dTDP-4-dehydrorhamnose 3,5-epimerase [Solirubrobacteraceae bacterium]